ncbi:hypothetical protein B296_00043363 [Ensete ventricosum]|uniref:Uncharacterized protein n=1 Tax=Ensete ventricosum TaxID=4639 RepID=A0A426ZET5_ENSVE|nr:hypothetical protein B296_00043363 [Ensete ventricosum]
MVGLCKEIEELKAGAGPKAIVVIKRRAPNLHAVVEKRGARGGFSTIRDAGEGAKWILVTSRGSSASAGSEHRRLVLDPDILLALLVFLDIV